MQSGKIVSLKLIETKIVFVSLDMVLCWGWQHKKHVAAQVTEALRYKSEGRGLDSR
jgi:hypothetical protein